jgi:hypothetical protein
MLILTGLSGLASDGLQGIGRTARIDTSKPAKKSVRTKRYNSAVPPFQQSGQLPKNTDPKTGQPTEPSPSVPK